jgi:two-component system, NarL family, sensor histidine kinase DesK
MKLLPAKFERTWEIYAVLLFLLFFLAHLPELSWPWRIASVAATMVFLLLYFVAHWLSGAAAAMAAASIAAIGAVFLPVNAGATVFFSYAAALIALLLPRTAAIAGIALVLAAFAAECFALGLPPLFIVGYGAVTLFVAIIYLQVRRSEQMNHLLHLREEEIEEISRQAERQRIALDLHDMLGQSFSLISVKGELCRRLIDIDPAGARRELTELSEAARSSLAAIRTTIEGYAESKLDDELSRASDMLAGAGVEFTVKREAIAADPIVESFLALILRECVTNVVRHARAKSCTVEIGAGAGETTMTVHDDGAGARGYDGTGIRGMQERARRIGASLSIARDGGTRVSVTVPRQRAAASVAA